MLQHGLLVRDKDLPAVNNLCERHALVALPLLHALLRVYELYERSVKGSASEKPGSKYDNEVVNLALEVNLGLSCIAAHGERCVGGTKFVLC